MLSIAHPKVWLNKRIAYNVRFIKKNVGLQYRHAAKNINSWFTARSLGQGLVLTLIATKSCKQLCLQFSKCDKVVLTFNVNYKFENNNSTDLHSYHSYFRTETVATKLELYAKPRAPCDRTNSVCYLSVFIAELRLSFTGLEWVLTIRGRFPPPQFLALS